MTTSDTSKDSEAEISETMPFAPPPSASHLSTTVLAALGVVFGDIGTSPLYAFKTVLSYTGGHVDPTAVLGLLSLIIWTLVIVTTLKYVVVAMSMDNGGEGGILALMSLIRLKGRGQYVIVAAGLFGAALIYGDGAITPAISVLSAVEGLNIAEPSVKPYVLPLATTILVLLFAVQPLGTARIGGAFGPIMTLWFLALAAMGIAGILHHPGVLAALNPAYAIGYLITDGFKSLLILGGIFLCVTGAEALYADMGQFGAKPIRIAWLAIVFPSLLLNYTGQAAFVLAGVPVESNIFYQLCPKPLLIPLVILATLATVIASQSIITGAFSMTRQAIHFGWLPRLDIKHTSNEGYGQVYIGSVNWIMMAATVALALGFKKSEHLANAYGIAVSLTMLITTSLLFVAMREVWRWSIAMAGLVAACFFIVDIAFFSANLLKLVNGGYIPLLLAAAIYSIMRIWRYGSEAIGYQLGQQPMSVEEFNALLSAHPVPRVPGTAIFFAKEGHDIPNVLLWHLKHNRSLHRILIVLTVKTIPIPRIDPSKRLTMKSLAPGFWRGTATYGFMEHPHIPALLASAAQKDHGVDLSDVTYYIGHASIVPREHEKGIARWKEAVFAALERNSSHVSNVLRLPQDQTVEIGRQVEM